MMRARARTRADADAAAASDGEAIGTSFPRPRPTRFAPQSTLHASSKTGRLILINLNVQAGKRRR